jgi:hypothetical protein
MYYGNKVLSHSSVARPVNVVVYGTLKVFRQRKVAVDDVPSFGDVFKYHIKYSVFGSGTFIVNLYAFFPVFLNIYGIFRPYVDVFF